MTARAIHLLDDNGGYEFRRWSLAALIVLAAHVGIMATYFLLHTSGSPGTPNVPAILVDMDLPAAPPSQVDAELKPVMEEAEPEPQVMEVKPPEPIIEPPPPAPIESQVVLTPEPPKPPEAVKREEPPPSEPKKKVERKKPAQLASAGIHSDRASDRVSAPRVGASGAGASDWSRTVSARLVSVKRYPSGADSRREGGVVMLRFTLNRSGAVLSRSISRGSGNSELDQEVLAMVQRAAPFPPMPADMTQPSFTFTVPVRFDAR